MTHIVTAKAFNEMIKAMKNIIQPYDFNMISRYIHIRFFETVPGVYYMEAMACDGKRICEYVTDVLVSSGDPGPNDTCILLPRLSAKSEVTIEVTEDKTVLSFDDVTFTTTTSILDHALQGAGPKGMVGQVAEHVRTMRTKTAQMDNRVSVCLNAKYLMEAAAACKGCQQVRLDVGGPLDPVILTGNNKEGRVFHAVLPIRSSVPDERYRELLASNTAPAPIAPNQETRGDNTCPTE